MSIELYISERMIKDRIKELADEINRDYQNQEVILIGILNGAFMFCADLIRQLTVTNQLEFMLASSYGKKTISSGNVNIGLDIKNPITGKNVLIVEDIVDTGLTVNCIIELLKERNPKSIKLVSLVHKPARSKYPVHIDYLGFEIEDEFIVGYGLDFAGLYRGLPYIGIYRNE